MIVVIFRLYKSSWKIKFYIKRKKEKTNFQILKIFFSVPNNNNNNNNNIYILKKKKVEFMFNLLTSA